MKSAMLLKEKLPGFKGHANLYKLSEPLGYSHSDQYEFVIVSAVVAPIGGPKTFIFGANEVGVIVDFGELPGSFKGGMDHETALNQVGYEVISQPA